MNSSMYILAYRSDIDIGPNPFSVILSIDFIRSRLKANIRLAFNRLLMKSSIISLYYNYYSSNLVTCAIRMNNGNAHDFGKFVFKSTSTRKNIGQGELYHRGMYSEYIYTSIRMGYYSARIIWLHTGSSITIPASSGIKCQTIAHHRTTWFHGFDIISSKAEWWTDRNRTRRESHTHSLD